MEIDTPLRELADLIGLDKATAIYRACQREVSEILALITELGIACHATPRPSLYLAGNKMGAADLADEAKIREQANLPSRFVTRPELRDSFGFRRDAALYSQGGAEADPVLLARGLAQAAGQRGARFFTPVAVTDYDLSSAKATILTDGGHEIGAKWLILANGYEMPPFVPAKIHKVSSTWVVASQPGIGNIWPQNVSPGRPPILISTCASPPISGSSSGEPMKISWMPANVTGKFPKRPAIFSGNFRIPGSFRFQPGPTTAGRDFSGPPAMACRSSAGSRDIAMSSPPSAMGVMA